MIILILETSMRNGRRSEEVSDSSIGANSVRDVVTRSDVADPRANIGIQASLV